MAYASLHNHTSYSNLRLRDSINTVKGLMDYAIELNHSGIAYTEHETIADAIEIEEYYEEIKKDHPNFKVIRGNEIYLVRNGLNADNFNKETDKYTHFILLALDAEGHKQIREISTRAWLRSYMQKGMRRVPTYYQDLFDIIEPNKGHIIGTTACIGSALGTQLLRYNQTKNEGLLEKIKTWCVQLNDLFGEGNFYLEMQPSNNQEQIYVNNWIIKLSQELNIPFIITNDAHYLKKEDLRIEKIFLNAQGGNREVESFYETTYLMSENEIHDFMDPHIGYENVERAFRNSEQILNRAQDYTLKKSLKIPSLQWRPVLTYYTDYLNWFERIPMLKTFLESEYEADRYLVNAVIDGIMRHQDLQCKEAYDELNACLKDTWVSSQVNKAQWSAYFLNLQRIIDVCWEAGTIVGCGRGSGVGFLLLYCLDITQINPLREATKTYRFRFLNPNRVSVLDIDVDITGLNRKQVLNYIKSVYGEDRVANVLTLRTEKPKSAILAAARGLGIDVDIAQYIANLIPMERGQLWSLHDCMYGNGDDRQPIKQFVFEMTENFPEIWEVVSKTEGLIVGMGEHAGGVVFVDEPFVESTALLRAPNGDIMTQFELHTSEKASLIKYDLLSVEAIDKIQVCLDLLINSGYVKKYPTLKETYEQCIGIYNLERNAPEMWEMVYQQKIGSLFQMDAPSGKHAVKLTHPNNVDDLATINSVLRLMPQEKGEEMPLDKFARFKKDINLWYDEMRKWGLTDSEMKLLEPIAKISYGITEAQEKFMQLVQMPECGGFDLTWADKLRKSIAKKNPKEFDQLTEQYYQNIKDKNLSYNLCNYVWKVLVGYSRGYGFNASHTLAYSLIALQEMNLAFKYPLIFWNCACLISDAGGGDEEEGEVDEEAIEETKVEEVYYTEMENFDEDEDEEESSYDEEDSDGYPSEIVKTTQGKKKKKTKTTNYGKIAAAIGRIKSEGVSIAPPNINDSTFTFSPDVEQNAIRYGLSGITRIGEDLVKTIIDSRPYKSLEDFIERIKVNKLQMVSLLKAGAFDCFGDRVEMMHQYINNISGAKKELNLRNAQMLIKFELIPEELDYARRVFNFNKYLKENKNGIYYNLDNVAFGFYSLSYDIDILKPGETESGFMIEQTKWDKIYKKEIDVLRAFIKNNQRQLLDKVNNKLTGDLWNKYCQGNISKWEMASISCYIHPHELAGLDYERYGLSRFGELPEHPIIQRYFPIKGKLVPIYKLDRIIGTVLDRDKNKKLVTLLTEDGVVTVKVYGVFANYDKQISEKDEEGHKHVLRKSEFARGNIIIVTGIRDGEHEFRAKKYSNTPFHLIETVVEVKNENDRVDLVINNRNDE